MGTFLWPWQPLPTFQQLREPQYCHLPLGEAYELKEFLQKKQDKSSTGRATRAEARSFQRDHRGSSPASITSQRPNFGLRISLL